ncbi:MAG: amidohydrolase [Tateyamaria sp.]|uniref:amidohydrolase n=1 Tax=Tateyamaria sp. TaxID=1929288 RepID=UPI00329D183B
MNRLLLATMLMVSTSAVAQEITVLSGGNILTMDQDFSIAEAMAFQGNEIIAVGTDSDVRATAGDEASVVDLGGKTVMPGFIDAHTHPIGGGASSVFENVGVDRFTSVEEALVHMKSASESVTAGDWVLFVNLDLATQSFAETAVTRVHLDDIAQDAPMVVWHAGGHKMTVNSTMLELMGFTDEAPDPEGGQFGRSEDGRLDGNLSGNSLLFSALAVIEPYQNYDRVEGTRNIARGWARTGVTTVGVAGVANPKDWEVFGALAGESDFPIRTRTYLQWALLNAWDDAGVAPGDGDAMARVVGWKISADGSNQAYTGLQREPYLNSDNLGLAYMIQNDINFAVADGTVRGGQMAMHGNGNASIDNIIAAVAKVRSEGIDVVRPRIEHCSITEDDQIAKLKELDISCSFLIAHVLYWGEAFRDNVFGPEKAAKLDRTGSFERAGVPYSLHTDYSVSVLSPLQMVEVAVTRSLFTDLDAILAEKERASVDMALRAVTSVPAFQLLSEEELGSLEVGKLADFVVLAEDPRSVSTDQISEIDVLETWMDGQRRH